MLLNYRGSGKRLEKDSVEAVRRTEVGNVLQYLDGFDGIKDVNAITNRRDWDISKDQNPDDSEVIKKAERTANFKEAPVKTVINYDTGSNT